MSYRCEATSVVEFVHRLAVYYVRHGYWFYVTGLVPERKDPARIDAKLIDAKLIDKYGIDVSKWTRARRKQAGLANMQYIRHDRFFVLMATKGNHRFFGSVDDVSDGESQRCGRGRELRIRDARRAPIHYAGYAISFRNGHVCVRIARDSYLRLKAHFTDLATRRSAESLAAEFRSIGFEPYAPVRRQIRQLWRIVNAARKTAGETQLSTDCVTWYGQSPVRAPKKWAA